MCEEMSPLEKYAEWRKHIKDSRSCSSAATIFQIERNTQSVLREFYKPDYPRFAIAEYAWKELAEWKSNAIYRRKIWKIAHELRTGKTL